MSQSFIPRFGLAAATAMTVLSASLPAVAASDYDRYGPSSYGQSGYTQLRRAPAQNEYRPAAPVQPTVPNVRPQRPPLPPAPPEYREAYRLPPPPLPPVYRDGYRLPPPPPFYRSYYRDFEGRRYEHRWHHRRHFWRGW